MPIFYILDEFAHRINHRDQDYNFRLVPMVYIPEGCAYSALFPIKNVQFEDEVTRDYLEGPEAVDIEKRQALLNIWSTHDMQHIDWTQTEPKLDFFTSSRTNETLPDPDFEEAENLPFDQRKIKVYTEYENIAQHLSHPSFEIVDNR